MPDAGARSVTAVRGASEQVAAARGDTLPIGQQLAGVFKEHHAIAQEAPSLFRMSGDDMSCFAIDLLCGRAGRVVRAEVSRVERLEC
jgi:hypothetical protein